MPNINYVTVIGAGTMGAAIAGHLANAGIPSTLLDMVPRELTTEEEAAGLSLEAPKVRNRIVQGGFERMVKAKPANLFSKKQSSLISLGNLEDDFDEAIGKSDWIIEVIVERPGPKQALMERIEATASDTAIISSNTSGIPINIISQGRSDDFKKRFLGTHFFNPPRYLHLLEVIPTQDTDPAVVAQIRTFGENVLGKGVVICKDTPNFIGNRMFSIVQSDVMEFAMANGYTVEAVDRLTGPLLGRPKTGTFRLSDVVGNDIGAMVGQNLYDLVPDDEDRELLRAESSSSVFTLLLDNKLLGNKTGQGFYKTVKGDGGKREFWALDLDAAKEGRIEYIAPVKPRWPSVGMTRDMDLPDRLRALVDADDDAGKFVWHTLSFTMSYAAKRVPEIADTIVDIDNAMCWGFGWEMGPFQTWDVLGVGAMVEQMKADGIAVAPWVEEMLAGGHDSFYKFDGATRMMYSPAAKGYVAVDQNPLAVNIADSKRRHTTLAENDSASLIEMDEGVLLLEFHSKMNAFDEDIFKLAAMAVERMHGNATGLVITNDGENFSVGANLFMMGMAARNEMWDQIEMAVKQGQDIMMALRRAPKPVVAAPFQRALGGGAEVCMNADRIVAHAETYMGLVEVGVGIVPGWGGCKELVRRIVSPPMKQGHTDATPFMTQVFETIGLAQVSTSAAEAQQKGFLGKSDKIVLNREHLLARATQEVLAMSDGYTPPVTTGNIYAAGMQMLANVYVQIYGMGQGHYISPHDAKIARKLGYVLCGGELSDPTWMDEQYFLDLEREAILSLLGEEKTLDRISYMLQNGKPLRN
ncbi:MAG: 3-hydroxyacyl-CoA dehydrogenase NAD-binding domain-containing protein [Chloroflexota bacterium]